MVEGEAVPLAPILPSIPQFEENNCFHFYIILCDHIKFMPIILLYKMFCPLSMSHLSISYAFVSKVFLGSLRF